MKLKTAARTGREKQVQFVIQPPPSGSKPSALPAVFSPAAHRYQKCFVLLSGFSRRASGTLFYILP